MAATESQQASNDSVQMVTPEQLQQHQTITLLTEILEEFRVELGRSHGKRTSAARHLAPIHTRDTERLLQKFVNLIPRSHEAAVTFPVGTAERPKHFGVMVDTDDAEEVSSEHTQILVAAYHLPTPPAGINTANIFNSVLDRFVKCKGLISTQEHIGTIHMYLRAFTNCNDKKRLRSSFQEYITFACADRAWTRLRRERHDETENSLIKSIWKYLTMSSNDLRTAAGNKTCYFTGFIEDRLSRVQKEILADENYDLADWDEFWGDGLYDGPRCWMFHDLLARLFKDCDAGIAKLVEAKLRTGGLAPVEQIPTLKALSQVSTECFRRLSRFLTVFRRYVSHHLRCIEKAIGLNTFPQPDERIWHTNHDVDLVKSREKNVSLYNTPNTPRRSSAILETDLCTGRRSWSGMAGQKQDVLGLEDTWEKNGWAAAAWAHLNMGVSLLRDTTKLAKKAVHPRYSEVFLEGRLSIIHANTQYQTGILPDIEEALRIYRHKYEWDADIFPWLRKTHPCLHLLSGNTFSYRMSCQAIIAGLCRLAQDTAPGQDRPEASFSVDKDTLTICRNIAGLVSSNGSCPSSDIVQNVTYGLISRGQSSGGDKFIRDTRSAGTTTTLPPFTTKEVAECANVEMKFKLWDLLKGVFEYKRRPLPGTLDGHYAAETCGRPLPASPPPTRCALASLKLSGGIEPEVLRQG